jgi:pyrimidine-specific ribonucleoside hydrolase
MRHTRLALVVILLAAGLPAGISAQAPEPVPVIIDTDMGADDWMAILYLLQHRQVETLAITVTGTGIAHCDPGTQNAMNLLALTGEPDIPVACGRETPLQGDHAFPDEWRAGPDAILDLDLPENPNPPPEITAVDLLAATMAESPEPVVLITLGPLTNVAEALAAQPDLAESISRMVITGGAVEAPGTVPGMTGDPVAEWNIWIDPLAAQPVFESGVPITLVPLDATNQVPVTPRFAEEHTAATPEAEFVLAVVNIVAQYGDFYFWDPLGAAIATDDSLATLEERHLVVTTDEGAESGRLVDSEQGSAIRVAVDADAARFETLFMDTLNQAE